MNILSPSILSADFGRLKEQIQGLKDGGAQCVHFDVMDGHFVPEISFGEPVLRAVRGMTDLALDVHLMVTNPDMHIEALAKAGADSVTFHFEAMSGGNSSYGGYKDLDAAVHEASRIIAKIHSYGMKAGVSIKPRTPVEVVIGLMDKADLILVMTVEPGFGGQKYIPESTDRIRALRTHAGYVNPELRIEVDGGIKTENVQTVLDAGADMIVAGSAVLGGDDVQAKARAFMDALEAA